MQTAGDTGTPDKSIGPPVRKKRGPQDDNAKTSLSSAGLDYPFPS